MTKPITPDEVLDGVLSVFPPQVIEAFNDLIVLKHNGNNATICQDDVVRRIMQKMPEGTVFNDDWLNIENVYYSAGWRVKYEKAEFNGPGPSTYTFTSRGK